MKCFSLVSLLSLVVSPVVFASESYIPRAKLTDGELTCKQIYAEAGEMEKIINEKSDSSRANDQVSRGAGVVESATAFVPFLGVFGNATKAAADSNASDAKSRLEQAKARHDHLTGLFAKKDCKASKL